MQKSLPPQVFQVLIKYYQIANEVSLRECVNDCLKLNYLCLSELHSEGTKGPGAEHGEAFQRHEHYLLKAVHR